MSILIYCAMALVALVIIVMIVAFIVLLAQGLHMFVQARTAQNPRR
jgi:hypothetical protein